MPLTFFHIMRYNLVVLSLFLVFTSCINTQRNHSKELFQGIWLEDDSEAILFKVSGDTIYYADSKNEPVYFEIIKDSLFMYGNEISRYRIDKQTENEFWFHALSDNIIKLHKSDNLSDTLLFDGDNYSQIPQPVIKEVAKRDTLINANGKRYRFVSSVVSTDIKVIKTSYSEEGLSMDNVFYDNIVRLTVYEDKKEVYNGEITKELFKEIVPEDFIEKSILSDVKVKRVTNNGYQYVSILRIPESYVSYVINTNIRPDGSVGLELVE